MGKSKKQKGENYLERRPGRPEGLPWHIEKENTVTLDVENRGFMNRVAQKLFRKPRVSHIHLDPLGSFVWIHMDGVMDIAELGKLVKTEFGESAEPLYERLAKYFQILDSYSFVEWK